MTVRVSFFQERNATGVVFRASLGPPRSSSEAGEFEFLGFLVAPGKKNAPRIANCAKSNFDKIFVPQLFSNLLALQRNNLSLSSLPWKIIKFVGGTGWKRLPDAPPHGVYSSWWPPCQCGVAKGLHILGCHLCTSINANHLCPLGIEWLPCGLHYPIIP